MQGHSAQVRSCRPLGVALLLGFSASCENEGPEFPYGMTEVSYLSGLGQLPSHSNRDPAALIEVKGGGLALIDGDGDGDLDLFLPACGGSVTDPDMSSGGRYMENLGRLKFRDATQASGLSFSRWSFGTAVGDVNGDGLDDLFVCAHGPNSLFLQQVGGGFRDASASSGLAQTSVWSTAASFGDFDGDGDLDLYVANYVQFDPESLPKPMMFRGAEVFGGPLGLSAEPDEVYLNEGDGSFVPASLGFAAVKAAYGLGVVSADFDGDGTQEIFVGNDSGPNFFFQRGADGLFSENGLTSGIAFDENGLGQATMGIALGDVNRDGRPDVFTSNFMGDRNTLHLNLGDLFFDDATRRWGLGQISVPYLGWATTFLDMDCDGTQELLVFNGHVYGETICRQQGWSQRQPALLFRQVENRFEPIHAAEAGDWVQQQGIERGAVCADLDRDGDMDLVVRDLTGSVRLLRNDAAPGRGILLSLQQPGSMNRRAIGSRVALLGGPRPQYRWITSSGTYQSANAQEAQFGTGSHKGPFQAEVTWPDGSSERFPALMPGMNFVLVRGSGE
ncbi:MAG: CRTAC1 family protein [bacterium]